MHWKVKLNDSKTVHKIKNLSWIFWLNKPEVLCLLHTNRYVWYSTRVSTTKWWSSGVNPNLFVSYNICNISAVAFEQSIRKVSGTGGSLTGVANTQEIKEIRIVFSSKMVCINRQKGNGEYFVSIIFSIVQTRGGWKFKLKMASSTSPRVCPRYMDDIFVVFDTNVQREGVFNSIACLIRQFA